MNMTALCRTMLLTVTLVGAVWAENETKESQVRLELDLSDGSRVIGVPRFESVPVQTSYAKIDLQLKQILAIKIGEDHETASVDLRNGDKLKGVINLETIKLETLFGKVTIGTEHLKGLRVVLTGGKMADGLKEGLVLYYAFDRDENGKVLDGSGKGNHGTVNGALWNPNGRVGGAYKVGKRLGYLQTPDQAAWSFGSKPFSICLWLKLDALPSGEQMLIGHDEGGGQRNKWVFGFSNGDLYFHINNPNSASYRIAAYPWTPQVGKWYHLAVTRSENGYNTYVDGFCVATDSNRAPVPTAEAPLTIGQAEGLYVEGLIDETMIFDRALSNEEVKNLYESQK